MVVPRGDQAGGPRLGGGRRALVTAGGDTLVPGSGVAAKWPGTA